VDLLVKDGRASGRELALATGISEANVSRRLARLFEERSVRVTGFVAPEYLGYHVQFAAFLRARSDPNSLAARLAATSHFTMVMTAFGFCDVIAYGLAENSGRLMAIADECIFGQTDIAEVDLNIVLNLSEPCAQLGAPSHGADPRPLDETDRAIIRAARADGRISYTELAAAVGISPTSAADRFRRLVSEGVVRILGLPDPRRVGLNLTGYLHVKVNQPVREVRERIAAQDEIGFTATMSGAWPIGCEFMVRDDAHLDDLQHRIMALPGVAELRMALHRRVHRMGPVAPVRGEATAHPASNGVAPHRAAQSAPLHATARRATA
jgi:Lrp/AsnC family transcriptional regulator for asnA, asnC and gidA